MNALISINTEFLNEIIEQAVRKAVSEIVAAKETTVETQKSNNFVSKEGLARMLNVSSGWIYLQMRDKNFPYHKMGRRLFFDINEVNNFLKHKE